MSGKSCEEILLCRFLWCHLQTKEDPELSSGLSLCPPGKGEDGTFGYMYPGYR